MAKTSMIQREKRRAKAAKGAQKTRTQLKDVIKSVHASFEDKMEAVAKLSRRKRDESPCRGQRRCMCCGRPHGVYRKFKLCRICLRNKANLGHVPGLVKASW